MSTRALEGTARERLLSAASELFYAEGVHTVGIDRVIERAGVAKASLYSTFGSKDALVNAYLQARHETRKARLEKQISRFTTPRDRILSVFDLMAETIADPQFRGCAFVNASAEGPKGKTPAMCRDSRGWLRGVLIDLASQAGARDPEDVGRQLTLLYDGAIISAHMDRDRGSAARAKAMAVLVLDAAGA